MGELAFNLCDDLAIRPRLRRLLLAILGCTGDGCILLQSGNLDM
jgi:hypothetical protein